MRYGVHNINHTFTYPMDLGLVAKFLAIWDVKLAASPVRRVHNFTSALV